jgi:hypothetical protein
MDHRSSSSDRVLRLDGEPRRNERRHFGIERIDRLERQQRLEWIERL